MIKVGRFYREKIIELLKREKENSQGILFINFKGLDVNQLNVLRRDLRDKGKLIVAKNSLIRRAFSDLEGSLDRVLKSETGLVYSSSDIVSITKTLFNFKKENQSLDVKAALIKNNLIEAKDLEELSKLPSREVLLGSAVNCIASPLIGLVNSLNEIILKFIWAIEEIKKKKETD